MAETQRLFVGLPIPGQIREQLTTLQPRSAPGLRPVSPGQMHVTLHFIGNAEPRTLAEALGDIVAPSFIVGFDTLAQIFYSTDDLVTGDYRQSGLFQIAVHHMQIRATQTAGADLHQQLIGARLRYRQIGQSEWPALLFQQHCSHGRCSLRWSHASILTSHAVRA